MHLQAKEPIGDDLAKGLVALSDDWLRPHRCVESKEDSERFCDEREPAVLEVLTAAASPSCPRLLRCTDSSSSTDG